MKVIMILTQSYKILSKKANYEKLLLYLMNSIKILYLVKSNKMFNRFDGKEMKVSDFNYILFFIVKYYIDQITIEIIESMTYKFFLDLIVISEENVSDLQIVETGREKLANDAYLLILSSAVDKFLGYSFLNIDISDFQPKIESKSNEILKFLQKYNKVEINSDVIEERLRTCYIQYFAVHIPKFDDKSIDQDSGDENIQAITEERNRTNDDGCRLKELFILNSLNNKMNLELSKLRDNTKSENREVAKKIVNTQRNFSDDSDDDYNILRKTNKVNLNKETIRHVDNHGSEYLKYILSKNKTTYSNIPSTSTEGNFSIHNYLEVPRRKKVKKNDINKVELKFQENDLRFECVSIPSCPSVVERLTAHSENKDC